MPIAKYDQITSDDIDSLKNKIIDSGINLNKLVSTAWYLHQLFETLKEEELMVVNKTHSTKILEVNNPVDLKKYYLYVRI